VKKILFLDLEETVIDDFHSMTPINIAKVRGFIKKEKFDEIRIFSFAIFEKNDVLRTQNTIIPMLEALLECSIAKEIITVGDMVNVVRAAENLFFEFDFEFTQIFRKEGAFLKIAKHSLEGCEAVLLDDTVEPFTGHFSNNNVRVRMINVADEL